MKKMLITVIGLLMVFLLVGCQGASDEAEKLRQQVRDLENQLSELMQPDDTSDSDNKTDDAQDKTTDDASSESKSMDELTALVDEYVQKAEKATSDGSDNDMEKYFSLRQESKKIERYLDCHEDEIEKQYRDGELTRDEYRKLEQKLDALEDKLDKADDRLEHEFGIID